MAEPDIRVLVGTEGAGQIDGKSGKLIQKELKQITAAITGDKVPRIALSLDIAKTTSNFQKQLNDIINDIKTNPVKITVDTPLLNDISDALSAMNNKGELTIREFQSYLRPFAANGNIGRDKYEDGVFYQGAA